jgi:hypothetical protein
MLVVAVVPGGENVEPFMIPIVAIIIGVPGGVAFTALAMTHARKMKELKLREKELEVGGADAELGRVVEALSDDLNETRASVAELQERLDFAERLLTSGRPSERNGSG